MFYDFLASRNPKTLLNKCFSFFFTSRHQTNIITPTSPIFVSQAAVYEFLGSTLEPSKTIIMPLSIQKEIMKNNTQNFDLQDVCNGVVQPVTGEPITKYKTLANDPTTKIKWQEEMCVELGRLSQGYKNEEGTNTIKLMEYDDIKTIHKNRTVTYTRIVVDYGAQKADPNRVRISALGNLIY